MYRRIAALAAGAILTAAMTAAGVVIGATNAGATTLTCTHSAGAVTVPVGCGGLQSVLATHGTLDMAVLGTANASGNYFNSPVGVKLDTQTTTPGQREDFTVFAVGGAITGGLGGLGQYVAMYTPNGHVPGFPAGQPAASTSFTPSSQDFCLSVTQLRNGPRGALRWNAVLRNCNTNGTFHMGDNAGTENSVTFSHANRWQVWAPTTGAAGLEMVNVSLHNHFNVPYVLDIKGSGGDGSRLLAFPTHNAANEEWTLIGCTKPASEINGGSYAACP